MSPSLALFLWLILLVLLLRFDPAKAPGSSLALWVPVIWMFIVGSRLPSQWFGGAVGQSADALQQGNPLDAIIYSVLMLLAIGILLSRPFNWGGFFARNLALILLLLFSLTSILWSDFPLVALKRWFRDLGGYLVMLVVVSDRNTLEAARGLLRRFSYLLISLSVLIVKYYPQIGKQYDVWTGVASYVGAATSKNMLGLVCLVSGLFFFWDTVTRWSDRQNRRTRRIMLVNITFMAMTFWLLNLSSSATSTVCLTLGCLIIAAAHHKMFQRNPGLLKALIPAVFLLYLIVIFGFGMGGVAGVVGRDPTLTDRTKIWAVLLDMDTDPLLGTGYESFWLGPRLLRVWQSGVGQINEAHNGYLQVYLNLGIIGLLLLAGFLVASFRTICRKLKPFSSLSSLSLAVWLILLFYNTSEAAFQGGLLWLTLLPGVLAVVECPSVTTSKEQGDHRASSRCLHRNNRSVEVM